MKVRIGENKICISTESEVEAAALKQFEGQEGKVVLECYVTAGFCTNAFINITFHKEEEDKKQC